MKHYSVEEVIKMLKELLAYGHGKLVIDVYEHKIPHVDYRESRKPEEGK